MKTKRITKRELDELHALKLRHGACIAMQYGEPGYVMTFRVGFRNRGTFKLRGFGGQATYRHALEILRTL